MHARPLPPAEPAPGLEALYRAHAPRVAAWVRRLDGHEGEVDDLVHEVFLVAARKLAGFRGDAQLTSWLYAITERVVLGHRRRRAPLAEPRRELVDERPNPETQLAAAELEAAVHETLSALSEREREVLERGLSDEAPPREIARALALEPSVVWVRAHRAKKAFRREFARRYPSLIPVLGLILALGLLSLGATAVAHWVKARGSAAAPPSNEGPAALPKEAKAPSARATPETSDPGVSQAAPPAPSPEVTVERRPSTRAARAEPEGPVYSKRTIVHFEPEEYLGTLIGPFGTVVHVARRPRFRALSFVRTSFAQEILNSVERL